MSVTFHPEILDGDERGWGFECYPQGEQHVYGTREDAVIGSKQHETVCEDCRAYSVYVSRIYRDMPEVNMANGNARYVLGLLGLPFEDGCGVLDAAAFAERIEFASVVGGGDEGSETVEYQTEGGATMVWCGRPVGYADERLRGLAEVAAWAVAEGRRVVWA